MPSGRLGTGILTPSTNTAVLVCAAGKTGAFNLNIINRTGENAVIRVAIVDGDLGDLAEEDYIDEPTEGLPANGGVYKLTGEPIGGAVKETVVIWSDKALTWRTSGFIGSPMVGEG